jgi:hypothetical protein
MNEFWHPTSAKLVRKSAGAVDRFEGLAEFAGDGVGYSGCALQAVISYHWRHRREYNRLDRYAALTAHSAAVPPIATWG